MLHRNLFSINTALTMVEFFSAFHSFCYRLEIQWCWKRPNLCCRTWPCVLLGKSLVQCHQAFFFFPSFSLLIWWCLWLLHFRFFSPHILYHAILLSFIIIQSWALRRRALMIWNLLVLLKWSAPLWPALPARTLFWPSMVAPFLLCYPLLSLFIGLSGVPIVLSIFLSGAYMAV